MTPQEARLREAIEGLRDEWRKDLACANYAEALDSILASHPRGEAAGARVERDEHMVVTLNQCGECEQWSSAEAWTRAWWEERSRRKTAPEWNDDDYGKDWGLDETMVCPRCQFVHADDDNSWVEEARGTALRGGAEQLRAERDGAREALAQEAVNWQREYKRAAQAEAERDRLREVLDRIEGQATGVSRNDPGTMWLRLDRIAGTARSALSEQEGGGHPARCPSCGSDDPTKVLAQIGNDPVPKLYPNLPWRACPDPFHNPQEENDAD